ncbi:MAG: hypothetical protein NTV01_14060, partial [Bacteroidia bacterium]|nr:hypothetical protein [Bacteroidia bacterium]
KREGLLSEGNPELIPPPFFREGARGWVPLNASARIVCRLLSLGPFGNILRDSDFAAAAALPYGLTNGPSALTNGTVFLILSS